MSGFALRRRLALLVGLQLTAGVAAAHEGPPYPILVDRPTGPVQLSVWTDPDVGTGTYHLYLEPLAGRPLPPEATVEVFVQPVDGRLAERGWAAEPLRRSEDRQHYVAQVEFDAVGRWTTRIVVRTPAGEGTASAVVEVTPPGQGPVLDFVLYLFPFVAVGALAVRAILAGRRRPPARPGHAAPPGSPPPTPPAPPAR